MKLFLIRDFKRLNKWKGEYDLEFMENEINFNYLNPNLLKLILIHLVILANKKNSRYVHT